MVETSSFKSFPQQFRTFDIAYNGADNTLSIKTTNVDPAIEAGSLGEISRSYAIALQQIYNSPVSNPVVCQNSIPTLDHGRAAFEA